MSGATLLPPGPRRRLGADPHFSLKFPSRPKQDRIPCFVSRLLVASPLRATTASDRSADVGWLCSHDLPLPMNEA